MWTELGLVLGLAVTLASVYFFCLVPRRVLKHFAEQGRFRLPPPLGRFSMDGCFPVSGFELPRGQPGVQHQPFVPVLGQIVDIQRAADSNRIVEHGLEGAERFGYTHVMCTGPIPQLVVCDPETLKDIFGKKAAHYHKSSENMKQLVRPLLKNGLLLSEDEYWKRQRTLVSPAFHYSALHCMVPMMVDAALDMCNRWQAQIDLESKSHSAADSEMAAEIEIGQQLTQLTLDTVASAAFGAAFRQDPELARRFTEAQRIVLDAIQERTLNLTGILPKIPTATKRRMDRYCAEIHQIVRDVVRRRREGETQALAGHSGVIGGVPVTKRDHEQKQSEQEDVRSKDLLELMLTAELPSGENMPIDAVEEESINFIAAGAETTSNLITWMLYRMATEPGLWERCADEVRLELQGAVPTADNLKHLKLVEAVAYEALRLHPPAPVIPKIATETHTVTYCGREVLVPAGTSILVNANIVHRHPRYWPQPERFLPERFTSAKTTPDGQAIPRADRNLPGLAFAFLGFSAGPRKCIGKNFALLEIKTIVALVLQRFALRLVLGQTIQPDPVTRLPKHGIRMRVVRLRPEQEQQRIQQLIKIKTAAASSVLGGQEGGPSGLDEEIEVHKPAGMI